jgi:8-oxo-dGTP pyrophosphatase MutT (NUDIX family)
MSGFMRRAKRTVYENPWLRFEAHDIVHPNGMPGEHGVVATPPASAVVPVDGSFVWLTRQARFAIDATVLEIVKGGRDPGEDALAAAQRELREELGLQSDRWEPLGIIYEIPSIVASPITLFLAHDVRAVATSGDHEGVESIDAVRMPLLDALFGATNGRIDDAATGVALLRAARKLALI